MLNVSGHTSEMELSKNDSFVSPFDHKTPSNWKSNLQWHEEDFYDISNHNANYLQPQGDTYHTWHLRIFTVEIAIYVWNHTDICDLMLFLPPPQTDLPDVPHTKMRLMALTLLQIRKPTAFAPGKTGQPLFNPVAAKLTASHLSSFMAPVCLNSCQCTMVEW